MRWLSIDADQIPFNVSLRQIADPVLMGSTQFLQGVSEQAQRQSAIAKYLGIVGGFSADTFRVFTCWSQWSAVQMMLKHYISADMTCTDRLEILKVTITGLYMLGENAINELLAAPENITG